MATLSELNFEQHGKLKVSADSAVQYAERRHMIPLKVTELAQAITCFPVFISRLEGRNEYALSAITGLEAGKNFFAVDGQWEAIYQPSDMQTYPVGLMAPDGEDAEPALGVDLTMPGFSEEAGQPLFTESGQPSLWLDQTKAKLLENARNNVHTYRFFEAIREADLIAPITISVHNEGEQVSRIAGLHTINEDRLKSLSSTQVDDLNKAGFLAPIHALLFSIFQLNALIQRSKRLPDLTTIERISLERAKSPTG